MIVAKTFINFAVTINTYLLSLSLSKKSHHDPTGQIAAIRLPLFLPSSAVSCKKKKMTVTWKHEVNYQRRRRSAVSSNFTLYIAKNLQCVCAVQ
jgi:hypothetical protein